MKADHSRPLKLLEHLGKIPGVKKVFVASGLRHDLILADKKNGVRYLKELLSSHTSGQMKIAPEHASGRVLSLMGKPSEESLINFKKLFDDLNKAGGKKQFLTYYFIAAHPGCTMDDMQRLKTFAARGLNTTPRQVQIFTPLPSTWSALMYHTGIDPASGHSIFVEKETREKQKQKDSVTTMQNRRLR